MRILGIDPGITGALVLSNDDGRLSCYDMPVVLVIMGERPTKKRHRIDPHELVSIITSIGPVDMVVLEEAGVRPGESAVGAFSFGRGFGYLEMVCVAFERPLTVVRPAKWTKQLGIGADKGAHRLEAMRLFPQDAALFSRVKDDGRADAALLTHWYSRGSVA